MPIPQGSLFLVPFAALPDKDGEPVVAEKMATARIIHLATHGLLESENGFTQGYLSAVALGPSDGEDGFLTVRETTLPRCGT